MSVLAARGVSKRYGTLGALDGVDIDVSRGEAVALLGASGSGKSTLLRLLHLIEPPDAGTVLFDGAPPRDALAAIRRMGLVQQKPGLLRMSAWENVAFPLRARGVPRAQARARAVAWLARFGLEQRAEAHASVLSGGEAQRVGLARALAPRPDVLLLDEATNQLDPESARAVEAVLREEAHRGAAVLIVTHSVAQAKRVADRVVFLREGRVVEAGGVATLDAPASEAFARFVAYA